MFGVSCMPVYFVRSGTPTAFVLTVASGPPSQLTSAAIDTHMRDDLERLKKIRNHRGLRTYWGLRVRGQHTKTTGRWVGPPF